MDRSDGPDIIEVAVGVLIEHRGGEACVLITRRPRGAILGGYWELPGGKTERGESAADCVVRELMEEVGLRIRVDAALPTIDHAYEHGRVRLRPFFCTRLAGEPQNREVAEHRWVGGDHLENYDFPSANTELMEAVREVLAREAP